MPLGRLTHSFEAILPLQVPDSFGLNRLHASGPLSLSNLGAGFSDELSLNQKDPFSVQDGYESCQMHWGVLEPMWNYIPWVCVGCINSCNGGPSYHAMSGFDVNRDVHTQSEMCI